MSDGGKGSGSRPIEIPREQFNINWDSIFGKKKESVIKSGSTGYFRNEKDTFTTLTDTPSSATEFLVIFDGYAASDILQANDIQWINKIE